MLPVSLFFPLFLAFHICNLVLLHCIEGTFFNPLTHMSCTTPTGYVLIPNSQLCPLVRSYPTHLNLTSVATPNQFPTHICCSHVNNFAFLTLCFQPEAERLHKRNFLFLLWLRPHWVSKKISLQIKWGKKTTTNIWLGVSSLNCQCPAWHHENLLQKKVS